MKGDFFMKKKFSRIFSLWVSTIMVLSLAAVNAGASETWFDKATPFEPGKSTTVIFNNHKVLDYKIEIPETGELAISFDSTLEYTALELYDKDGVYIKPNKTEATVGDIYNSTNNVYLKWNRNSEKAVGTSRYTLKGGTYYFRVNNSYVTAGSQSIKWGMTSGRCRIGVSFKPDTPADQITDISISIRKGDTLQLGAIMSPANSRTQPQWRSSNANIAAVSANGTVTAKESGSAFISATAGGKTVRVAIIVRG